MRGWYSAVAFLLALALPCGALAQVSSALVVADPKAQYYIIKRAMQQMYERGGLHSNISRVAADGYDIVHCESGSDYFGEQPPADALFVALANLAADIVIWRNDFRRLAVPEAVWRPVLIEIEDTQLAFRLQEGRLQEGRLQEGRLQEGRLQEGRAPDGTDAPSERRYASQQRQLLSALNAYRAQSGGRRAPFQMEGGCGAGDFNVTITAAPRTGRVFFIPVFFHELCKAQQLDPDDRGACNHWREAVDGTLAYVAGDYRYQAVWPDGATRSGPLSFTHLQEGQIVTIRKP